VIVFHHGLITTFFFQTITGSQETLLERLFKGLCLCSDNLASCAYFFATVFFSRLGWWCFPIDLGAIRSIREYPELDSIIPVGSFQLLAPRRTMQKRSPMSESSVWALFELRQLAAVITALGSLFLGMVRLWWRTSSCYILCDRLLMQLRAIDIQLFKLIYLVAITRLCMLTNRSHLHRIVLIYS